MSSSVELENVADDEEQIIHLEKESRILIANRPQNSSSPATSSLWLRLVSVLAFAFSSIGLTMFNKTVLTIYSFPSVEVVAISQMICSIHILATLHLFGKITLPPPNLTTFRQISPLPIVYALNVVTGLASTGDLSLPMWTALRRIAMLMTLVLEYYMLGVRYSRLVLVSVGIMMLGAAIAALSDLAFNAAGYAYITCNNVLSAWYSVDCKAKLNAGHVDKYGLIFYNCFLMLSPMILYALYTGGIQDSLAFTTWDNAMFQVSFLCSASMGFVLMWTNLWATQHNSALLVAVVGCMKNVFISYIGLVFGGDYIFSWNNFFGLTLGVIGSIMYTYSTTKSAIKESKLASTERHSSASTA